MSYLEQDDPNLIPDLLSRKEFFWTQRWNIPKIQNDIIPRYLLEPLIKAGGYLKLMSHQEFTKNFLNPNTNYKRLHLKWSTGSGKTIGALAIAMNFINLYRIENELGHPSIGSVFIIGFAERAFKNELLRHPEFGFLSREEKQKLDKLKQTAAQGMRSDIEKYRDFITKIKKRFSNRRGNGFFKFYGYKAFVNRFWITDLDITNLSEDEIYDQIQKGRIKYNQELLSEFKNSLIICDEIHNTYNTAEKNNWGVAIQSVLDAEPTCRLLTMSATPLNNSPAEIVDLLNLLLPKDQRLIRNNLFKDDSLKPGAIEKIAEAASGRFSFLMDVNYEQYPRLINEGVKISGVPYLTFVRCPMSAFHYMTYQKVYHGALSLDSQYLVDFAIENPEDAQIGIYQTNQIKRLLPHAPQSWKDKYGFDFQNDRITGEALQRKNLQKYSSKYCALLDEIRDVIKEDRGKIFIYHNIVHMSGVLFIEQILLRNGFIDENGTPSAETICVICGKPKKEHDITGSGLDSVNGIDSSHELMTMIYDPADLERAIINKPRKLKLHNIKNKEAIEILLKNGYNILWHNSDWTEVEATEFNQDKMPNTLDEIVGGRREHSFIPARFTMVHSEIDKATLDYSLEKYNAPENALGHKILILVGSKIIKESYDLKCIQNLFVVGRPDNIPTLIQIRGRAVRKNSHIDLPENKRRVIFKIFTTCLPIKKNGEFLMSYEEEKYADKIKAFRIIQQIERVIHENSIDAAMNYHKLQHTDDPLGILAFKPKYPLKGISNMTTFDMYYQNEEIKLIKSCIKRLFIELSSVWTYDDLLKYVRNNDFESFNTDVISEGNFKIALDQLTWHPTSQYVEPLIESNITDVILQMTNSDDKIILCPNGQKYVICYLHSNAKHDYYIMCPLDNTQGLTPNIDVELPYRITKQPEQIRINMNSFVQNKKIDFDYEDKRKIFYRKYSEISIENMENIICEYGAEFHIKFLEECIEYVFNAWTSPTAILSDQHEFYFKMLYYYDLMSLVIWAYTCKPRVFKQYEPYAIPVKTTDIKLKTLTEYENRELEDIPEDLSSSGMINLLKTTFNRTSNIWIPREFREQYNKTIDQSLNLFIGRKKKISGITKVKADLLPVGHYISKFPRLYLPNRGFDEEPTYNQNEEAYIENDIIIGFDERSDTGIHIRYKIRNPIHNIKKHKDTRMIEKGVVCKSKSKPWLKDIARKLGVELPDKTNVEDLCSLIRSKLIRLELKERIKKSKIKYYYFHFEQRPETVNLY